jgi:hypothetical protein
MAEKPNGLLLENLQRPCHERLKQFVIFLGLLSEFSLGWVGKECRAWHSD